MLSLFPFAENQDDYAFDKKILYDNGREKDYLAIEKNGSCQMYIQIEK